MFAAAAVVAVWAGPVGAETQDIDFHEIFATLTTKVERTSDLAFFETQVCRGGRFVRRTHIRLGRRTFPTILLTVATGAARAAGMTKWRERSARV